MGVRRASVGRACRQLERQGLIAYGRARLTVVNRAALENFACPCYRIVKSEFERLLPEHVSRG
jgi:DNA-binding transcriptional regulator YhcF (GntR family)